MALLRHILACELSHVTHQTLGIHTMSNQDHKSKDLSDALNVLGVKDIAPQIYEDLLQPAAKELGQSLVVVAKAVSIALSPVEGAVWGFDKIRDWLAVKLTQKLSGVDANSIVSPPLNIAGPTLLNMSFCRDLPLLREMYANLLASSMNKEDASSAHPSFVRIVEQLSPDEAKILSQLSQFHNYHSICQEVTDDEGRLEKGSTYIFDYWTKLCENSGVESMENSEAYMDNLIRLRLIEIHQDVRAEYQPEGYSENCDWGPSVTASSTRTLSTTSLGERFFEACIDTQATKS